LPHHCIQALAADAAFASAFLFCCS